MKKLNKKSLVTFLCLIISIICLLSFNYFNVGAVTVSPIALNEKRSVSIGQGIPRYYSYEITDNKYYVVETRGSVGTYISVSGLSSGAVSNGEGGVGTNARVGFVGEAGKTITISVKGSMPTYTGTSTLQIRRQQAVLYGFKYKDINTIPDLNTPYSCLSSKYDTYKFTDDTIESSHMLSNDERGYKRLDSEIVFFSGHGYSGGITFPSSKMSVSSLSNLENVKIAVWSSCYSADINNQYKKSVIQASVIAGVKSAIGWEESINDYSAFVFTDHLFEKLAEGGTIKEAAEYAKKDISALLSTLKNYKIEGDENTTIVASSVTRAMQMSDQSVIEEFQSRTADSENWITQNYNNDSYDVCRTINDCLTNDFYSVSVNSDGTKHITHSGVKLGNQKILPAYSFTTEARRAIEVNGVTFKKLVKCEKKNYYHISDNVATPMEVSFNTYETDDGSMYQDIVCINLNDGSPVDIKTILTVNGDQKGEINA